ncbi:MULTISPECIES: GNAT family N-acetyltransferase [unclassified Aureimonas]|uniref:GNAT family N-acetyltransferase n=1 Tax=unclassified Aureimonas TaxID=2615206 RepID=UPI000700509F|nr:MULTISPECIES: GNAT family N-acetyltransferase [unclassified Aureimonas]KQT60617.1 GCN5 family acetyltransferase [Aureimonas sp. Leaf427]KQT79489.1 GCN5 family acetyltransferase [Aureimonas sp. Leaf460]
MFFVRTAGTGDLPAVRDLLGEAWHATYDAIYGVERVSEITASWHSVEALRPRLTRPNSEFLVADDGVRLGGMAFAATSPDKKLVLLHQLYVCPDCQRQNVGSNLLAEIETSFPEAERMRLEVEEANVAAVGFYRLKSFAVVGRTENAGAGESGLPALIFEKQLG